MSEVPAVSRKFRREQNSGSSRYDRKFRHRGETSGPGKKSEDPTVDWMFRKIQET